MRNNEITTLSIVQFYWDLSATTQILRLELIPLFSETNMNLQMLIFFFSGRITNGDMVAQISNFSDF